MGHGDAGQLRNGDGRGHSGHHVHLGPGLPQLLRLLGPAAEEERVAALEADHGLALLGVLHQELVGLPLAQVVVPGPLPGVDELGALLALLQQLGVGQGVVHDDVGAPEQLHTLDREKAGVSRPRAD